MKEHSTDPTKIKPEDGPFTDECGTTVTVTQGEASVSLKKMKGRPHQGKTCISKITAGSNDDVTIDVAAGHDPEIDITGKATVTINGNDLGTKLTGDGQDPS